MSGFDTISQPKRKRDSLSFGFEIMRIIFLVDCHFCLSSSLHIDQAKSSKMIPKRMSINLMRRMILKFFMMDGKDELDTLFGTDFISKVVKLVQNTQGQEG